MADFFDYLNWRGDLSFSASPFNDVDALIFCQLSYANFDGLIPDSFDKSISLHHLVRKFREDKDFKKRSYLGLVINAKTIDLLFRVGESERFANVRLCGYKNVYSRELSEQFCAITVSFGNRLFVVFRGTDDTIVGWKEDFNLAFDEAVPAQKDAVAYLEKLKASFGNSAFSLGGHSKGGNLAIYSAAHFSNPSEIEVVYNFDGPGFIQNDLQKECFLRIKPKVKSFYPDFSIVGMLFHHFEKFEVVKNSEKFLMQHDPFAWQILGGHFEIQKKLNKGSIFFYKTFNSWFEKLSVQKRAEFVETLFSALESSEVKDFSSFAENGFRNFIKTIRAFDENDSVIKKSVWDTARKFLKEAGATFMSQDFNPSLQLKHKKETPES
ncbi:Mbeg1-like protein [Treponema zioleckii]|uniref:Mbeg1-like protein n=1 Tax=Treponema zioleckii TaxID=331680 RepID=UPI00168B4A90|nr:Mbeg1-like protein [Treponema zioleckii]